MLKPIIYAFFIASSLAGCAGQSHINVKEVEIGDASGYVKSVKIKQDDITSACDFSTFEDGFKYTYMSMWNGRIEEIIKADPEQNVIDHYTKLIFNSKHNVKATLDEDTDSRSSYSYCQESSYQQGKISGFLYSVEDLKALENKPPI
ncbi:hypothetical protein DNK06_16915 [Pseudomonas daroniae]|uniref:Uncharacterized protein n=1 Tax=Phytopseudomonas daroniae TaxID=2487519 RepID=A0A4Q9QL33_9GAMM|nr:MULTISPECIES: hypothetical protein [Pseudomonas]TBU76556.1 hypothetical protein DNK06_16915 [Pseudomonas daroniae]TBU80899.1 hypothetical protein DNK31_15300 [Pseudomonas sp. FRB 228]TBU90137.1 hypothetical protein DNJ99_14190 [Pseudomonas daroniae]